MFILNSVGQSLYSTLIRGEMNYYCIKSHIYTWWYTYVYNNIYNYV